MDDEHTLKIKVVHGADSDQKPPDQSPPIKPPANPQAPASPSSPGQATSPPSIKPPGSITPPANATAAPITLPKTPPITTAASVVGQAAASSAVPAASGVVGGSGAATSAVAGGGGLAAAALGPITIAAGAVVAAFGALQIAATTISAVFANMAERLKEYDPGIAIAEGISEMRKVQADIKAARDRSNDIQSITKERTNIDVIMTQIGTDITKVITPASRRMLEIWETVLLGVDIVFKLAGKLQDGIAWIESKIPDGLKWIKYISPLFWEWGTIAKKLSKWLGIQLDDEDASTFQKDILDALNPHRSDIRKEVNRQEGGRTPRGVHL